MSNQDKIIGSNLRNLREALGFTQDEVSTAIGVTRSAYANYELGAREMPYDILIKASDLFGCESYLLYEESEEARHEMLSTAFRIEGLSEDDFKEIIWFKDLIKTNIKLNRLMNGQNRL
ncbi:MAG: helix-turn-helix domain-containing protein [Bacteroidales bacterium]|nr:helix-turn-helix domain-containing protein [Bacteroidales bacterium]